VITSCSNAVFQNVLYGTWPCVVVHLWRLFSWSRSVSTWTVVNWRCFANRSVDKCLLDGYSLVESSHWVLSFELLELNWSVLVKELVDREVPSTNSDVDSIHVDSDWDFLGTELVNTLGLSHEEDLQLLSLWEIVDVLSQLFIDRVLLNWNINRNLCLQI